MKIAGVRGEMRGVIGVFVGRHGGLAGGSRAMAGGGRQSSEKIVAIVGEDRDVVDEGQQLREIVSTSMGSRVNRSSATHISAARLRIHPAAKLSRGQRRPHAGQRVALTRQRQRHTR